MSVFCFISRLKSPQQKIGSDERGNGKRGVTATRKLTCYYTKYRGRRQTGSCFTYPAWASRLLRTGRARQGKCIQSTESEEQKNTLASSDLKTMTEGRADTNSFQILDSTSQVGHISPTEGKQSKQVTAACRATKGARQATC